MRTLTVLFGLIVLFILVVGCEEKEKPFVEPAVIEQLNYQEEVPVTVQLRSSIENDTNILNITDRKEKLDAMKEYYKKIIDEVIVGLDEADFKREGRSTFGPAFYGSISKSGLEKLSNDPRVESIYLRRETHTTTEPKNTSTIDLKVIERLENYERVRVLVQLVDNIETETDITIINKDQKLGVIKAYYNTLIYSVLTDINTTDFELIGYFELSPAFYGYLSSSGLEKLRENPKVLSIYLDEQETFTVG